MNYDLYIDGQFETNVSKTNFIPRVGDDLLITLKRVEMDCASPMSSFKSAHKQFDCSINNVKTIIDRFGNSTHAVYAQKKY